mgnify:CR=1 FL=1
MDGVPDASVSPVPRSRMSSIDGVVVMTSPARSGRWRAAAGKEVTNRRGDVPSDGTSAYKQMYDMSWGDSYLISEPGMLNVWIPSEPPPGPVKNRPSTPSAPVARRLPSTPSTPSTPSHPVTTCQPRRTPSQPVATRHNPSSARIRHRSGHTPLSGR